MCGIQFTSNFCEERSNTEKGVVDKHVWREEN
jgi:hypothetical protein